MRSKWIEGNKGIRNPDSYHTIDVLISLQKEAPEGATKAFIRNMSENFQGWRVYTTIYAAYYR